MRLSEIVDVGSEAQLCIRVPLLVSSDKSVESFTEMVCALHKTKAVQLEITAFEAIYLIMRKKAVSSVMSALVGSSVFEHLYSVLVMASRWNSFFLVEDKASYFTSLLCRQLTSLSLLYVPLHEEVHVLQALRQLQCLTDLQMMACNPFPEAANVLEVLHHRPRLLMGQVAVGATMLAHPDKVKQLKVVDVNAMEMRCNDMVRLLSICHDLHVLFIVISTPKKLRALAETCCSLVRLQHLFIMWGEPLLAVDEEVSSAFMQLKMLCERCKVCLTVRSLAGDGLAAFDDFLSDVRTTTKLSCKDRWMQFGPLYLARHTSV